MNKLVPARAAQIALLKGSLETKDDSSFASFGHVEADRLLGGLRLAVLHEVFAGDMHGGAATGFAAALARLCQNEKPLFWIRQDFSALEEGELSAHGFLHLGLDPGRLFLMRAADAVDVLRGGFEALTCPFLGAVIMEISGAPKTLDLTATRRLQLAAQSHGVTAILLRFSAKPAPSACETRWLVSAALSPQDEEAFGASVLDVRLDRNRHGPTGQWVMEWSADGFFKEANSGALAATPFDRSHQTRQELRRRA
jgi:protein ImuA